MQSTRLARTEFNSNFLKFNSKYAEFNSKKIEFNSKNAGHKQPFQYQINIILVFKQGLYGNMRQPTSTFAAEIRKDIALWKAKTSQHTQGFISTFIMWPPSSFRANAAMFAARHEALQHQMIPKDICITL